jgi:methylthioribose-1-phosphate isomerase
MRVQGIPYRTVWAEGDSVKMINQTLLPHRFEIVELSNHRQTAEAIRTMIVRGAGAIGAAAGYAMAQVANEAPETSFREYIEAGARTIQETRPTAQNLFYAVNSVVEAIFGAATTADARKAAKEMAGIIADADAAECQAIGEQGAALIKDGARILTHCNAGWLAFVDWGSALAPIYAAVRGGKSVFVYADETRPRCQGAMLTAWELQGEGIPHAIIADNAAGFYLRRKEIDLVIVGSDRIAANGDVANKIGTYEKAVVAKENGIPFYVAAPATTIDTACPDGDSIPIEERDENEVLTITGLNSSGVVERVRISHPAARAYNPAFDVTPARYVTGIITGSGTYAPGRLADAISSPFFAGTLQRS